MQREEILDYLDGIFAFRENSEKYATNGLQVEGQQEITKIAFAVDTNTPTIERTIAADAQMLICHHGLFWPSISAITGPLKKQISLLLSHNISLVGMHLPLDKQPQIGNNISLVRLLAGELIGEIGSVSYLAQWPTPRLLTDIQQQLSDTLGGTVRVFDFSDNQAQTFAVCSGSGSSELTSLYGKNCDVFITGELRYEAIGMCREYGMSLIAAGHYATETTGIRALQQKMQADLSLKTIFIEDRIDY